MDKMTTTVATGFLLPESPRWHAGALWFVDMLRGHVHRLADGVVETIASFDRPAAVGFRPGGEVLVTDGNTRQLHTVRDGHVTDSLDLSWLARGRLNDMIVDAEGRAYIDDSGSDFRDGGWKPDGRILLVTPDGEARVVADNIMSPNGIGISPDGRILVVGQSVGPTARAKLFAFDVADDGTLSGERIFGTIERGGGDGLCFDGGGGVWVGTGFGHEAQRFLGGEVLDRIVLTDRKWATACALGGPGMTTLFICTTAPPPRGDPGAFTAGWIEAVEVDVPG